MKLSSWTLLPLTAHLCAARRLGITAQRKVEALTIVVGFSSQNDGPLGTCEGECFYDTDCEGELKCLERDGNEPVPGCTETTSADQNYGVNFCYDPNEEIIEGGTEQTASSWYDEDVELINTYTTASASKARMAGVVTYEDWLNKWSGTSAQAVDVGQFNVVNDLNSNPSGPLQMCEGDCDHSFECAGDLICYQRFGNEEVPGCTGSALYQYDFCYDPNLANNNSPVNPPVSGAGGETWETPLKYLVGKGDEPPGKLKKCEGDCDNDSECDVSLVCFQRYANEEIPGCIGDELYMYGADFCYDPSDGNGSSPVSAPVQPPDDSYPGSNMLVEVGDVSQGLGRCEGDCGSDDDCIGTMVCYKRDGTLTLVPGCFGIGGEGKDFCIDPIDNPSNFNKDTFRLKMFWREGYKWQEETFERKWCMRCDGDSCNQGDLIRIFECNDNNSEFQLININQNGDEAQIAIAGSNLCLEADANDFNGELHNAIVQDCDDSEINQKFNAGDGNFLADRFELQPVQLTGCLTNRHHPKAGEEIFTELCATARHENTTFWNRY